MTDTAGNLGGASAVGRATTSETGLTTHEVAERVAAGQVNDVPVRSSRSTADIVRGNVFNRINAIIGSLLVLILIVGPWQDALFGGVIVANSLIGIVQELRAKRTLDQLAVIGQAMPHVRRDGTAKPMAPSEIVLDDVIELGPGDKVVVDGKLVEADGLEIDESLLTGEADPLHKMPGDAVMSGSFVVAGGGAFQATKVGRDAYAAQLAEEASRFTLVKSELRNGINKILKFVTYVIIPVGIALVISQIVVNENDLPEAIRRMVAGLVHMVPEGLVLLTSMAFAVGVIRLGSKQCLVQELPAIEGLARVSVVCLDKTGTLTEGGMDVTDVVELEPGLPIRAALGALGSVDERPNASLQAIIDAFPSPAGWIVTEAAPFSSARKWSGATFAEPTGASSTWLLGAPDVLLRPGAAALAEADALGSQGLRILLLARSELTAEQALAMPEEIQKHLTPAALIVIEQRLRKEAPDTIRYFADQGVRAKVISGDNAVSVGAVAAKLDIAGANDPVDARTLPADQDELAAVLESHAIFGRVAPRQKRDMVHALQSRGHDVAMTGDGVNDVLALKDADIGVAMGSGSEATKAVAQIVLMNNNFSTLPSVVAEGRRVIGNIERVSHLFLTKTVYAALIAIVVVITQVPYPFLPRHLTLVGTLSIGVPAFFLALAPNTERARSGFVRRVLRFAIPAGTIAAAATLVSYFHARWVYDGDLAAETSAATLTLFIVVLWVVAVIARPYTWWRAVLLAAMGAGFALVLTVPYLQEFFQLQLAGYQVPWVSAAIGVAAGVLLEITWRLVDHNGEGQQARAS
ncbi:MAG TPA: HAD-IC family P-type ATPase [Jiangellaceae bacterium]|nr:HAD-IC family P-type ATPase [Jiangellaceae bacterium]